MSCYQQNVFHTSTLGIFNTCVALEQTNERYNHQLGELIFLVK